MTENERYYIAGVIDAKGTFHVGRKKNYIVIKMLLYGDEDFIENMVNITGVGYHNKYRGSHSWLLYMDDVRQLLEEVRGYMLKDVNDIYAMTITKDRESLFLEYREKK